MKKVSIILNIVLLLVTLFFVVFANIQTDLAKESQMEAVRLADEAVALTQLAEQQAALAKVAEAKAVIAKNDADKTMELLLECRNK